MQSFSSSKKLFALIYGSLLFEGIESFFAVFLEQTHLHIPFDCLLEEMNNTCFLHRIGPETSDLIGFFLFSHFFCLLLASKGDVEAVQSGLCNGTSFFGGA